MSDLSPFSGTEGHGGLLSVSLAQRAAVSCSAVALLWWMLHRFVGIIDPLTALALALAALGPAGASAIDHVNTAITFVLRSRWSRLRITHSDNDVTITAGATATVSLFTLEHRGRLDLSGHDEHVTRELTSLMDALAARPDGGFMSWHHIESPSTPVTALSVPAGVRPSPRWSVASADTVRQWYSLTASDTGALLERWTHLRTRDDVLCLFRVRRATPSATEAILTHVVKWGSRRTVSVIVRVETARRGRSLAGRRVHRLQSDAGVAERAGFRRRADHDVTVTRLLRNERSVSLGRALGEIEVFVVVHADTRLQLAEKVRELLADAERFGIVLQRGNGRHAPWFRTQLPGSPGWDHR